MEGAGGWLPGAQREMEGGAQSEQAELDTGGHFPSCTMQSGGLWEKRVALHRRLPEASGRVGAAGEWSHLKSCLSFLYVTISSLAP